MNQRLSAFLKLVQLLPSAIYDLNTIQEYSFNHERPGVPLQEYSNCVLRAAYIAIDSSAARLIGLVDRGGIGHRETDVPADRARYPPTEVPGFVSGVGGTCARVGQRTVICKPESSVYTPHPRQAVNGGKSCL